MFYDQRKHFDTLDRNIRSGILPLSWSECFEIAAIIPNKEKLVLYATQTIHVRYVEPKYNNPKSLK